MRELGVYFPREHLAVDNAGLHLVDAHFIEEGQQRRIDTDDFHGTIVGRMDPLKAAESPRLVIQPDGGGAMIYIYESLGGEV